MLQHDSKLCQLMNYEISNAEAEKEKPVLVPTGRAVNHNLQPSESFRLLSISKYGSGTLMSLMSSAANTNLVS